MQSDTGLKHIQRTVIRKDRFVHILRAGQVSVHSALHNVPESPTCRSHAAREEERRDANSTREACLLH